jgi:hypothetical protein
MTGGSPAAGFALEQAVVRALQDAGWSVDPTPIVGNRQPDLIATSSEGRAVLAEVKASKSPVSAATIAQIAAYRRAAEELPTYQGLEAVLFSLGPLSESARDAAAEMEIAVLAPGRSDPRPRFEAKPLPVDEIARGWVRELEAREGPRPVRVGDPALLEALPDPSLRHLVHTYDLAGAFREPGRRRAYFDLLRSASDALSRLLDRGGPNPSVLRNVAASALAEDEAFLDYLYAHVDMQVVTSPEIFMQLVQAAAGVLVSEYMGDGHGADR